MSAPTSTEVTVMRQANRTIVHLLHYSAERRAPNLDLIEDVVPLSLHLAAAPKPVYLAPERQPLRFGYSDGGVDVTAPEVRGHAMVVFE